MESTWRGYLNLPRARRGTRELAIMRRDRDAMLADGTLVPL
jgi:hypothetical protein